MAASPGQTTTLLAKLSDDSGINTTGAGIGHDITAVLDHDPNKLLVLNESYVSNVGDFRSGQREQPVQGPGHRAALAALKAWDTYNNSAEKEIEFMVANNEKLALDHVLNYPNPFANSTTFFFDHNQAGGEPDNLDVQVQIFTVAGHLVRTLNATVPSTEAHQQQHHLERPRRITTTNWRVACTFTASACVRSATARWPRNTKNSSSSINPLLFASGPRLAPFSSLYARTLFSVRAWRCSAGLLAVAATAQAQTNPHTITTAVPILTLSPDARSSALGEAGVATSPDANAAYFNPGKLGFVPYKYAASLSYSPWLRNITDDMSLSYLSGYGKVGQRSAFGASLMYFDLGQIDYRTGNNLPNGSFNPKEYALAVSYGQQLTDNFGVGVSARYIRSNLVGAYQRQRRPARQRRGRRPGRVLQQGRHHWHRPLQPGLWALRSPTSATRLPTPTRNNPSFLPTTLKLGTAITREIDQYNKITLVFDASKLLVPSPYYETTACRPTTQAA